MFPTICSYSLTCDFQCLPVDGVYFPAPSPGVDRWLGKWNMRRCDIHYIFMEAWNALTQFASAFCTPGFYSENSTSQIGAAPSTWSETEMPYGHIKPSRATGKLKIHDREVNVCCFKPLWLWDSLWLHQNLQIQKLGTEMVLYWIITSKPQWLTTTIYFSALIICWWKQISFHVSALGLESDSSQLHRLILEPRLSTLYIWNMLFL